MGGVSRFECQHAELKLVWFSDKYTLAVIFDDISGFTLVGWNSLGG